MKKTISQLFNLFILCVALLLSGNVSAQQLEEKNNWNFLVEPYLMFPNMSGSTGIRNLPAIDVDADAGDIFSKLQMGAMLYVEAKNNTWAITSDLLYMSLEQDGTPNTLIKSATATAKQLGWEVAGLYRLAPILEFGVGGRLNSINSELDITRNEIGGGSTEVSGSLSRTWVDPILITRIGGAIKDKWLLQFRGDFGGFNIGSQLTWQLQGYVGYKFSKVFQTNIGYRIISIDYDKGTDDNRFRYDMNIFGPVVKFGFNF